MALGRRQFLQTVTVGGFGLLAPGFHQLVAAAETASWFPNPLVLPPLEEVRLIDEDHSIHLVPGHRARPDIYRIPGSVNNLNFCKLIGRFII